jgi:hypothetical protein
MDAASSERAGPCTDGHAFGGARSWPVHYDGGNRTNHVCRCTRCGHHGVVCRGSVCPLKPGGYATPLGHAIRKREEWEAGRCDRERELDAIWNGV